MSKLNLEELLRLEALYRKAGVDVYELSGRSSLIHRAITTKIEGTITLRRALAGSRNVPAVKLAEKVAAHDSPRHQLRRRAARRSSSGSA